LQTLVTTTKTVVYDSGPPINPTVLSLNANTNFKVTDAIDPNSEKMHDLIYSIVKPPISPPPPSKSSSSSSSSSSFSTSETKSSETADECLKECRFLVKGINNNKHNCGIGVPSLEIKPYGPCIYSPCTYGECPKFLDTSFINKWLTGE
jgi:hypothetical protein